MTDEDREGLIHHVYSKIIVKGYEFVKVCLTPEAQAMGLALALPERVTLARPEGFEPPTI